MHHARPSWPTHAPPMHRLHARPSLPVNQTPILTPPNQGPIELHDTAAGLLVNKRDLLALYLSGTYCHRTDMRPPSCVTPRQPTIHTFFSQFFHLNWTSFQVQETRFTNFKSKLQQQKDWEPLPLTKSFHERKPINIFHLVEKKLNFGFETHFLAIRKMHIFENKAL